VSRRCFSSLALVRQVFRFREGKLEWGDHLEGTARRCLEAAEQSAEALELRVDLSVRFLNIRSAAVRSVTRSAFWARALLTMLVM